MNDELKAMETNCTWSVVPLPKDKHTIGCKWIYKIKHKEGLDYIETFSPVAKLVTIKVLLTLAASFQWPLIQLDVNNAFLHGDLFEEVYMDLPLGYNHGKLCSQGEHLVCKLHKPIYGLK